MAALTGAGRPECGRTAVNHAAPITATEADVERLRAHVASLAHELKWIERTLLDSGTIDALLRGRRFVYVGGRPRSNAVLREWLARAGGVFVHHVALIDVDPGDRATRFAALLPRTDAVLCPLDTIDPGSLAALRNICARHGVPWVALRTSNLASFVAGLARADHRRQRLAALPPFAHGCRRLR
ncbi:uncharacterized protein DUF2325 [Paraburkholderia silvatlantica]|uniref:Uncharacterized protein DUF2325 n=1 Tax=Paraburkholderia silvatlantica TaxID=321895 RepID=A0A2V4TSC2_9BURK|nr:DUF2325 domain-containing protein [Paraburkholderia silvatlantica]PYE21454.1 uncharacterized protein DUF2325 [Paraburkholderia silvatlantica]